MVLLGCPGVTGATARPQRSGSPVALAQEGQASAAVSADRGAAELHRAQIPAVDLSAVEACVDHWMADPSKQLVAEEVALFLGQVLYANLADSRWTIGPNGEPGIALNDGQQVDLFALGRQRVSPGDPLCPRS